MENSDLPTHHSMKNYLYFFEKDEETYEIEGIEKKVMKIVEDDDSSKNIKVVCY
jgi:hypothetical protein